MDKAEKIAYELEKAKKEVPKIEPKTRLEAKIMEHFLVYDHSGKQIVEIREIAKILRSLGCCPTEAEIQEVINTNRKPESDMVPLTNFLPYMVKVLSDHIFYPPDAETLFGAFRYFDKEGRGYLTKEQFSQIILEEGERFTQDEFDRMMKTALDPVTGFITYEYYINQLMIPPRDAYDLADAVNEEQRLLDALTDKRRRVLDIMRT